MPIHDLFYHIVLDTIGPFPKTKFGNKYILVAIKHYSKWCETRWSLIILQQLLQLLWRKVNATYSGSLLVSQ
jgi:hypothetical protein